MTETLGTVRTLMARALGHVFTGPSWDTWRAILAAAFALPLSEAERATVCELTRRTVLPTRAVRELWLLLGRRSGKSIVAALIAVWATTCRSYRLAPGEVGVFVVVAADRKQARVIKRYISGLLAAAPVLAVLVDHETADAIWLTNGLCIEIHSCSYKSLRGYTVIGCAVDEVSFWMTEDSANPDTEVLNALRASMASVPEAMLVGVTTLYAKRGEVGRIWDRHYGRDESESVLVVTGATLLMNPTIDRAIVAAAYEDDPIAAAAEYGGLFRRDVESLLTRDAIAAVTIPDRQQLPPMTNVRYHAFVDPAGGSGTDSFTAAVAHFDGATGQAVLDLVFERKPPFSPAETVQDIAVALAPYGLAPYGLVTVVGDRYAGEWPREQFRTHGLDYWPSTKTKSDLYRELVPLVNSQRVQLLDVPRLAAQLAGLERKTARGGRDQIDHPPGKAHDDVSNAAAGALVDAYESGAPVADILAHGGTVRTTADRERDAVIAEIQAREQLQAKWVARERSPDERHTSQLGITRRMSIPVSDEDADDCIPARFGRAAHDADPYTDD